MILTHLNHFQIPQARFCHVYLTSRDKFVHKVQVSEVRLKLSGGKEAE